MKTHIAHVGAFKRHSDRDTGRWMRALTWLVENNQFPDGAEHESINLKYGRDFLAEDARYDIVVLHDIFDGKGVARIPAKTPARVKQAVANSPRHSEDAWANRLASSGAKHIFVFETSPSCINGWGLGDLPGYHTKHRDTRYTVYERA